MASTCKKCGHEIDGSSPICMYCGAAIDDASISQEAKARMQGQIQQEVITRSVSNAGTSAKALGAFLIILGILADVVSMILIFADGGGAFGVVTVVGTVLFILGLVLVSNH